MTRAEREVHVGNTHPVPCYRCVWRGHDKKELRAHYTTMHPQCSVGKRRYPGTSPAPRYVVPASASSASAVLPAPPVQTQAPLAPSSASLASAPLVPSPQAPFNYSVTTPQPDWMEATGYEHAAGSSNMADSAPDQPHAAGSSNMAASVPDQPFTEWVVQRTPVGPEEIRQTLYRDEEVVYLEVSKKQKYILSTLPHQ